MTTLPRVIIATLTFTLTIAVPGNRQELRELKQEAIVLEEKLKEAINDSLTSLNNTNDDGSHEAGIKYLMALEDGLKDNKTVNFRRSNGNVFDVINLNKVEKADVKLLKEERQRLQHQEKVYDKLNAWIKDRKGRKTKKPTKHSTKKFIEKCPVKGTEKNKDGGKKKVRTYPCCKKCCKKSYLGC